MLSIIKQRLGRDDDEQGFTLIELMVVVLIIAILLAIAIPTFLGARNAANARAAQSDLRNADTAEQTYWTNNQTWDTALTDTQGVTAIETALSWTTSPVAAGNNINVAADAGNNGVVLTAAGKDNHCYSMDVIDQPVAGAESAGTYYYDSGLQKTPLLCGAPTTLPSGAITTASASKAAGTWALNW